jgi:hypothetical protein
MADTDYLLDLANAECGAIDLGGGHWARLFQANEIDSAGFFYVHPAAGGNHVPEGEPCAGSVTFDLPGADPKRARWQLLSLEPLHVEPSILCSCGRHGFVRNGKWEEA